MLEDYQNLKPGAQKAMRWCEGSVIICMGIVIISGILSIYGAQKTVEAFDHNCVYSTKNISFMSRDEGALQNEQTTPKSDAFNLSRTTPTTTMEPVTESTTKATKPRQRKINHIFRSLEPDEVELEEEPDEEDEVESIRLSNIDRDDVGSDNDFIFLSSMQVDVVNTIWSTMGACEYILYNQVLSVIAAMVCTTMLLVYNTTGKANLDWGIPKPWRIVFPAVIAFGVMSLVELIHILIVNNAQQNFCNALSANITTKSIPCYQLINALHISPIANSWLSPGASFLLHTVAIRMTFLGWFCAFIVMLARMLLGIDFRLVRVNFSPRTYQRESVRPESISTTESGGLKPIARTSKAERSLSSREDIDEYQSACSHFEPILTSQPTSLDPLLPSQTGESPTEESQA